VFENVCSELRKYLETKPFLPVLLGIDKFILLIPLVFMLISVFTYLGGLIGSLVFYAFILGIVLCVANKNFQALMIGLGARALIALIELLQGFFSEFGFIFYWSSFFALLIYGFFAYEAYKKTLRKA